MKCVKFTLSLFAALLLSVAAQAEDAQLDVFYWQFDDTPDNSIIRTPQGEVIGFDQIPLIDGNAPQYARVKVSGLESGVPVYLKIIDGTDFSLTDFDAAEIAGDSTYGHQTGVTMSDNTGYTNPSYIYTLELGYFTDKGDWIMMASSQGEAYSTLEEQFHQGDEIWRPGQMAWTPDVSVPEPSSALLMLVGGALLALKRRRQVVAA